MIQRENESTPLHGTVDCNIVLLGFYLKEFSSFETTGNLLKCHVGFKNRSL